jgi:signal transduction histidine kinase
LIAKAKDIAGPCDHLVARSKDSVEHVLDSFPAEYILLVDDTGIFQGIVTRSEMLFQANKRLRDCIRMSEHMTEEMRAEVTTLRKHSSDILSMLAHDLRGPLGGIQGVAQLITDESMPLPPDQIQHFAKLIAAESATLVQLTSSVLEASRVSVSSTVQLKMAICQPVDILQTACALYQIMARKKGITFTLNLPEKPIPDIVADRERIIRVLSNLLDNAIKYCRKGETIQTTIEATPRIVTFVISDNGQGLAKAEIPNLFKPFAKGSSRPTGGEPSSGLGLSIALDIMRSHGGSITASGDTNKGLSFRVSLGIHDLFPAHS